MNENWIRAHAAAQYESLPFLSPDTGGKTVKASITLGVGGSALRLVLEQRYGGDMKYGDAAMRVNGKVYPVTMEGQHQFVVRQGEIAASDAICAKVSAGDQVEIWLYVANEKSTLNATNVPACHSAIGNYCGEDFQVESNLNANGLPELLCGYAGIDVCVDEKAPDKVIAVLGDSITAMELWTGPAKERLLKDKLPVVLLNVGISGGRLLRNTNVPAIPGVQMFGASGLERLERDVLSVPGITTVAVAMGVNDISQPGGQEGASPPAEELCTAEELIEGFERLIMRCHEKGLEVIGCTITPFGEYSTGNPKTCLIRNEVNNWIRTSRAFDAVIDFAKTAGRSDNMDFYHEPFDSGDHLHPSAKGGEAMAETFLAYVRSSEG